MNDEDLREALRPPAGIEPLDPATVIAGARRRRKRNLATGGASAVAVLAVVVAASVFGGTRPTGNPVVEQPKPSVATAKPSRAATPKSQPNVPALVALCKSALKRDQTLVLGPAAAKQALLSTPRGAVIVIADSKHWAACDSGDRPDMAVREPGTVKRPAISDTDAFAVAHNELTRAGKTFNYYWAAGLLPTGVTTVRYTFPGGSSVNATVSGKYWLMQHSVPLPGPQASVSPERVRVQLLGDSGVVLKKFALKPGEQTCAQITHGC
ncbi:hypothetical protein [Kribbella sp. NPDC023855]|uniref:hypothetical protein n=1 Tax=Kribbella sp. NPDC023855 TaxID=3154698 RepID=UPI0034056B1A